MEALLDRTEELDFAELARIVGQVGAKTTVEGGQLVGDLGILQEVPLPGDDVPPGPGTNAGFQSS